MPCKPYPMQRRLVRRATRLLGALRLRRLHCASKTTLPATVKSDRCSPNDKTRLIDLVCFFRRDSGRCPKPRKVCRSAPLALRATSPAGETPFKKGGLDPLNKCSIKKSLLWVALQETNGGWQYIVIEPIGIEE